VTSAGNDRHVVEAGVADRMAEQRVLRRQRNAFAPLEDLRVVDDVPMKNEASRAIAMNSPASAGR
jgi:hypothetical protein